MTAFWKLTWTELKLQLREPLGAFFTLIFPLMLMILFGSIFGNESSQVLGGYGQIDLSVPGYIGMIVGTIGMLGLPISLASYREQGILRRFRATALRPTIILWSQVAVSLLLTALSVTLLVVAGRLLFNLRLPTATLALIPAILLGAFSFFGVGFVLAGVMPTARTAQAVGMALFFPMLFLSGAAIPRHIMPEIIQRIADFLPLTHVVKVMEGLWLYGEWNMVSLVVVAALLVAGLFISRYTFRWE